jgi:hypothetical protein
MNSRIHLFLSGFVLAVIADSTFLLGAASTVSGLRFSDFVADMVHGSPLGFVGVAMFLGGCVMMIWGVVSQDTTPIHPNPNELDLARANLEPWGKPAQPDPDAITRPGSSDIQ